MTKAPISVGDLLDEYIAELEEPRLPDGKWHPSSYWSDCDRKVIYEVRGTTPSNPHGKVSSRIFRIGHILHGFVQDALATSPSIKAVYPEFLIETKLNETGHGDALIALMDGTYVVLEIKSINAKGFGYVNKGPKEENLSQGKSYAVAARKVGVWVENGGNPPTWIPPLGDKLVGVIVFYLSKETFENREHFVEYDPSWATDVEARIAHLETYKADPESLPPRQKNKFQFPCSWGKGESRGTCPFFDRCWNVDGTGVKPVGATEVPEVYEW